MRQRIGHLSYPARAAKLEDRRPRADAHGNVYQKVAGVESPYRGEGGGGGGRRGAGRPGRAAGAPPAPLWGVRARSLAGGPDATPRAPLAGFGDADAPGVARLRPVSRAVSAVRAPGRADSLGRQMAAGH